jgi:hypothetical protein
LITALPRDRALELRVRVTADDDVGVDICKEMRDLLFRRPLREDVDVVARRRVAEEHVADLHGWRQPVEKCDLLVRQRRTRFLDHLHRRESLFARRQLAVGVAAQPEYALAQRA